MRLKNLCVKSGYRSYISSPRWTSGLSPSILYWHHLGSLPILLGNNAQHMPAAKKGKLQRLRTIVRKLASGLTVQQACACVGVCTEWFYEHTRPGSAHSDLRAKAEAAMIESRLRILRQAEKQADWKTRVNVAIWQLEKIYRRQYGEDKNVVVFAEQNNYTISDERAKEIDARAEKLALELD